VVRHADAGYESSQHIARDAFKKRGGSMPMLEG
jgi:hypothetical protein